MNRMVGEGSLLREDVQMSLYAALFFALLMLLWDIPFVRRRVKQMQDWPRVGRAVLNGYRRSRHLHRLRRLRRENY